MLSSVLMNLYLFKEILDPYLQYTYARCKSVLSKADLTLQTHNIQFSSFGEGEKRLLRLFTQFPDVVTESTILLSPGTLCNYLFILCQEFNLFIKKILS